MPAEPTLIRPGRAFAAASSPAKSAKGASARAASSSELSETSVTGTKSAKGSKPGSFMIAGRVAKDVVVNRKVWPSVSRATNCVPTALPAPGFDSITTGWPSRCDRCSAMIRAGTSCGPPGAKGLMKRIGRFGQACWARAGAASSAQQGASS